MRPESFTYAAGTGPLIRETAVFNQAGAAGTRLHFHEEAQLVLVTAGRRRLEIDGDPVTLEAGSLCLIAAQTAHRALAPRRAGDAAPAATHALTLYCASELLPAVLRRLLARHPWAGFDLPQSAAKTARSNRAELTEALVETLTARALRGQFHALAAPRPPALGRRPAHLADTAELLLEDVPVGEVARRLGMSREGYTRSFTRLFGLPPQAYRLNRRLNLARALLRQGEAVSAVAHQARFSDQSHFGRAFFAAFGTSPARYRAAVRPGEAAPRA